MSIDFEALAAPFPAADIEWRLQACGKAAGGMIWGRALPYLTSRAVQQRLDEVVGPPNWRNEFQAGPSGGVICGLSIRVGDEWVAKWDGAENTGGFEPVKGGLSGAEKRAAVQWGIGRYLYGVPGCWAKVHEKGALPGRLKKEDGGERFRWDPPDLPDWALPGGPEEAADGRARTESQREAVRLLLRSYLRLDELLAAAKRAYGVESLDDLDDDQWEQMARWVAAHISLAQHASSHGVTTTALHAAAADRWDVDSVSDLGREQIAELWAWVATGKWAQQEGEVAA